MNSEMNSYTIGEKEQKGILVPGKFLVMVLAAAAIAGIMDYFFDKFDFCPVCGGNGKTIEFEVSSRWEDAGSVKSTSRTCPLLWLFPDWHHKTA